MNEPLRYQGYTFYQASFIDGLDKETTVLATVNVAFGQGLSAGKRILPIIDQQNKISDSGIFATPPR